jgi:hypothetical protein
MIFKIMKMQTAMMKKMINFIIKPKNSKIMIIRICTDISKIIIKIKWIKVNTIMPENKEISASQMLIKSIKNKTNSI